MTKKWDIRVYRPVCQCASGEGEVSLSSISISDRQKCITGWDLNPLEIRVELKKSLLIIELFCYIYFLILINFHYILSVSVSFIHLIGLKNNYLL